MLNKDLEITLKSTFDEAKNRHHEFVTVEHLLFFLLDNAIVAHILLACGANIETLRENLRVFIDETTPKFREEEPVREAQPTLGFQRVLQRAVFHVQSAGKVDVSSIDVLVALFSEQESQAVFLLKQENITRLDVMNYIAHGIIARATSSHKHQEESMKSVEEEIITDAETNPLSACCVNLNQKASQGLLDPLVGREEEIQRTIQVLCRRRKNNPLLVGEAGVGKTAIAEGLAKLIVEGKVPSIMANYVVYSLDLGSLLAGTKYRGDFEKRFKDMLRQLKAEPGAVLFIDEIHTIIGAGAASGGVMDASNLLKPLLTNGELKCIGSTTYQEYRTIFEKDHALARRFQKIDVVEPTVEETYEILKGLKEKLETHHGVKFSLQALHTATDLAARYIHDRFLPDKAIDVMDEAGAYQNLLPANKRKKVVGVPEIEQVVAKMIHIPVQKVSSTDKNVLKNLEQNLKLLVYGQDEAISALASSVKLSRSGLREPNKPIGCYLFSGPTGVGKTEVSVQLANLLTLPLVRFDMSEYAEKHTVSRLIGAPPGYVGYEAGGLLTEEINKQPHCVLLLDEIEKAHPDIFNILLQVMDHGMLTDTNGRKVDFRNVILILTTNAGAYEMSRPSIGFATQEHLMDGKSAIAHQFSPEFRNRLDAMIAFASLNKETIHLVVNKFLMTLEHQLAAKNVTLEADELARDWLAEHGYDKAMGARPMSRLIQNEIKKPLADELLFGKLASGGTINISVKDNKLFFSIIAKKHTTHSTQSA
jgi:ATP-dependent Clp protease ATP-binding subunit ClpA